MRAARTETLRGIRQPDVDRRNAFKEMDFIRFSQSKPPMAATRFLQLPGNWDRPPDTSGSPSAPPPIPAVAESELLLSK